MNTFILNNITFDKLSHVAQFKIGRDTWNKYIEITIKITSIQLSLF